MVIFPFSEKFYGEGLLFMGLCLILPVFRAVQSGFGGYILYRVLQQRRTQEPDQGQKGEMRGIEGVHEELKAFAGFAFFTVVS